MGIRARPRGMNGQHTPSMRKNRHVRPGGASWTAGPPASSPRLIQPDRVPHEIGDGLIYPNDEQPDSGSATAVVLTGAAMALPRSQPPCLGTVLVLILLSGSPPAAGAQTPGAPPIHARVRVDLHSTERSLLRRPVAQPIVGTLVGLRGDTLLLAVADGAEPLRVPQTATSAIHVTRGRIGRFESGLRRALVPAVASAVAGALVASLRRDDDRPSAGEAAWSAARRTAAFTFATGFIRPRERWRRASLPVPPPLISAQGTAPDARSPSAAGAGQ